jgi:fatty acid synthase
MKSLGIRNDNVFVVHAMDGTVATLEGLASQLDGHVYGIECAREVPLDSIEKMASYYVQKIKEVQPRGPYKLIGYSFGGTVAFEMALQLEKENEAVAVLVLLDASPRIKQLAQNISESTKEEWENALFFGYLSQYKSNISPYNFKELAENKTTLQKLEYIARLLHEEHPEISLEEIQELAAGFRARAEIVVAYEPGAKVRAKTVLIKALQSKKDEDVPYDYALSDICEDAVEVVEVDGNHYCFYEKALELGIPNMVNKALE